MTPGCFTQIRYAFTSAMAGGGDYGVFADGRYQLSQRIRELQEWLDLRIRVFPPASPVAETGKHDLISRRFREGTGIPENRNN
ncbi:MAG: hypothetical protein R2941_06805 [Desulfobacterales bacterium]